ncbi:MAG TPA: hypothetical protein VFY81_03945 [Gammaproteobacteria bacterium]|nr:hypothetical protein [Gammaproteobacteria bacterium]
MKRRTSSMDFSPRAVIGAATMAMLMLGSAAALAENPTSTQQSEINPQAPGEPAGISPRGDYPPAQADPKVTERGAETIEKDALTPDKPPTAGADQLQKQQQAEQQSGQEGPADDAPRVHGEKPGGNG